MGSGGRGRISEPNHQEITNKILNANKSIKSVLHWLSYKCLIKTKDVHIQNGMISHEDR